MELIEIAKMMSKRQVTVPAPIRAIFNLKRGSSVIFKVTDKGVLFLPCQITGRDTYKPEEWGKIERMVAERGKGYKTSKRARAYLKSL
ncbi:MAG: AbrB/MazE/SpoVT family DNA-binding domain-containing protein [candidate division WOR-3 bacterium]